MTYIIIAVTVVVSLVCFRNGRLFGALALRPYDVWHRRQGWRVVTHGFVHGDGMHLFVNMLVFWSFGTSVERLFAAQEAAGVVADSRAAFALLYFGGMVAASLYDLAKRRDDLYYASVGASGAVAAVLFTSIFFRPLDNVYFFGVIPIPGILFGVLYLLYESYAGRRGGGRINHHAHIFGAVYGFLFPLMMSPSLFELFWRGLKF